MSSRYSRIRETLQAQFKPQSLEITDESAKHAGHAERNDLAAGETHYRVAMVSDVFSGLARLKRSRAVHQALDEEFKSGLHALSLNLKAPEEKLPG
jgi:stress-induced morphogen